MHTCFLTCAVTGNLTRPEQTPHLPITPAQIADDCLAAAEEGAAAVHIHVRDPATGRPSMDVELYRDVVDRIRQRNREVIINLTTGPGGRFVPSEDDPRVAAPGSTLMPPLQRVPHIALIKPDVCSLDFNTMNSGPDVVINTPRNVRIMARAIREAGVVPELEIFDSGDIHLARDLIADGTLAGPGLWTFVTGVKYGFAPSTETLQYARAASCRPGRSGRLSASAASSSRWWRRPGCSAATCASGWRTTSSWTRACSPAATPNSWPRRGASCATSAAN
jgi:uncharacterized protein (DUF849 family)